MYKTVSIDDKISNNSEDYKKHVCEILRNNVRMLVIYRDDDDKYYILAHTLKDWKFTSNKNVLDHSNWKSMNNMFGNTEFTLESIQKMSFNDDPLFSNETLLQMDMKNVEMFSGVVIKNENSYAFNQIWNSFNSSLNGNKNDILLYNDLPICGKLNHMCGEKLNGKIFVFAEKSNYETKTTKRGKVDFVGGKVNFKEYLDCKSGINDHIEPSFQSFSKRNV